MHLYMPHVAVARLLRMPCQAAAPIPSPPRHDPTTPASPTCPSRGPAGRSPLFHRSLSVPGVHKRVISELLRPRQWKPSSEDRNFMLQVGGLAARAELLAHALGAAMQQGPACLRGR